MLEGSLNKLGALMALGYGEAGSNMIIENMAKGESINPMVPGEKIIAIFGFCDVRKFTNATEILKEGIMLFVNEIGEICHGIVDKYSGAANKNIGDAFLFVWKFEKEDQVKDKKGKLTLRENTRVNQLCDMSAISFILLMSGLKKSRKLLKYKNHEGLNRRMPNYEVRLGLGLHLGYCIEGPLGSFYKIDPTYLSPHVKMAERLEGATKAFKVPFLMSGALQKYLSRRMKEECRQVDWVVFPGNPEPLKLFTIDVVTERVELEEEIVYMTSNEKRIKRMRERMERN